MKKENLFVLLGGMIFGSGLAISGMAKQEIVLSFLTFDDLGLLLVMGVGVLVTTMFYHLAPWLLKKPLFAKRFQEYSTYMTKKRLAGAAIFGAGWGISGICPGSALTSLGIGNYPVLLGLVGLFIGAYVQGKVFGKS